jgi:hypothetical protein
MFGDAKIAIVGENACVIGDHAPWLLSDRILSRKGIRSMVEVERNSLPLGEFDLENPAMRGS